MKKKQYLSRILCIICCILICATIQGCTNSSTSVQTSQSSTKARSGKEESVSSSESSRQAYIELNENQPDFTEEEKQCVEPFEQYSDLDELGRCGVAFANICEELQPTEERQGIGMIKPSGWHTVKYNDLIDGNYLYNRCHLIGYQLAGENANEKNLITGTRYLNVVSMLEFENEVDDYVDKTKNHVLYRVTPVFDGDNLVASGVEIEGWSVEDEGEGICFHVFCYNVQPGIVIDYANGESWRESDTEKTSKDENKSAEKNESEDATVESDYESRQYVVNTNTRKIHLPTCSSASTIAERNKKEIESTIQELKDEGYTTCQRCMKEQ